MLYTQKGGVYGIGVLTVKYQTKLTENFTQGNIVTNHSISAKFLNEVISKTNLYSCFVLSDTSSFPSQRYAFATAFFTTESLSLALSVFFLLKTVCKGKF